MFLLRSIYFIKLVTFLFGNFRVPLASLASLTVSNLCVSINKLSLWVHWMSPVPFVVNHMSFKLLLPLDVQMALYNRAKLKNIYWIKTTTSSILILPVYFSLTIRCIVSIVRGIVVVIFVAILPLPGLILISFTCCVSWSWEHSNEAKVCWAAIIKWYWD